MKLNRLLATTVGCVFAVCASFAQQSYAISTQQIRAGIVILDSAKANISDQPRSAAPHALYNLASNTSVKPAGWDVFNPHAPATLTQTAKNRWAAIDASVGAVPVGTRLGKRHAAYWEVFLSSTSDAILTDYDLLLVNPVALVSLNPSEREKLRRFVDRGGILWVDPGAVPTTNGVDVANNLPLPFALKSQSSLLEQGDFTQPIMNRPIGITRRDISYLDGYVGASPFNTSLVAANLSSNGGSGLDGILGNSVADFGRMQPFILVGNEPVATIGRIGDGFVVTTARGVSMKLNRSQAAGYDYTVNTGFLALNPVLEADGLAAAKIAVNMMYLATEYRQNNGGSRKSNGSYVDIGPPLLKRSTIAQSTDANSTSESFSNTGATAPVVYKGIIVATVGDRVVAYDADPQRDLDGDGDPDDGVRDLSAGASSDRLWTSASITTPLSSPTCVEIANPGGRPRDVVLVVGGDGNVRVFDLTDFSGDLNNKPALTTINAPGGGSFALTGKAPNAVTVHEGIGYVTDSTQGAGHADGRIWAIDLTQPVPDNMKTPGGGSWFVGGTGTGVTLPDFAYGATIGYIPIADNSGGTDKVMYVPYRPVGTPSPSNTAGFVSLWLGARGEKPVSYTPNAGFLDVETRASTRGLPVYVNSGASDSQGVRITLLDSAGNPFNATQLSAIFTGTVKESSGHISFEFKGGVTDLPANVAGVRVDYTINLGNTTPGMLSQIERGRLGLFNGPNDIRVIGSIAMSPRGTIFVVCGDGNRAGTLFAFREEGRGAFKCINRWSAYEPHLITLQGTTSADSGPMFQDNDGIMNFIPDFGTPAMTRVSLIGGPTVENGQVYVLAKAQRGFIANGIILAFSAEPQTPQFRIGDLPDGSIFLQSDVLKSTNSDTGLKVVLNQQSMITTGGYQYDQRTGLVRFDNLMGTTTNGNMSNCLSLSQPIALRKPGASTDVLIDPNTQENANWSPLLWYYVAHGVTPSGSALATGNSVFMAGTSAFPNIINFGTLNNAGILLGINGKMSADDPYLVPNTNKSYLKQAVQLKFSGGTVTGANNNVLWPQSKGIASIDDWIQRLNQTVLPGSTYAVSLVGGDGVLCATGSDGIYTYSRADVLLCDQGRVAKFDPSGNPIWSISSTTSQGANDSANVGTTTPIVRPTKAYKVGISDTLVVDTDANRIVRLNFLGGETRSISGFELDPFATPPNGYRANDPKNLSGPRDVTTFVTYETAATAASVFSPADGNPANEYWVHYVIADTGNKRLLELVDRFAYDPTTGRTGDSLTKTYTDPTTGATITQPLIGILRWQTDAAVSGKNFDYVSVNRVWVPNVPLTTPSTGRYVFVAGIGSSLPTGADLGVSPLDGTALTLRASSTGNGGVVVFDPAIGAPTVINAVNVPAIGPNVLFNDATQTFVSNAVPARQLVVSGSTTADLRMKMSGVQSVTARALLDAANPSRPSVGIMVADAQGVYEFNYTVNDTGGVYTPTVSWFLPNNVYTVMRRTLADVPTGANPLILRATYAKRLDSGEVLVVNGASSPRRRGNTSFNQYAELTPFLGEIIQLSGDWSPANWNTTNLGFKSQSIQFELPTIQGARGLVQPVFAIRN